MIELSFCRIGRFVGSGVGEIDGLSVGSGVGDIVGIIDVATMNLVGIEVIGGRVDLSFDLESDEWPSFSVTNGGEYRYFRMK